MALQCRSVASGVAGLGCLAALLLLVGACGESAEDALAKCRASGAPRCESGTAVNCEVYCDMSSCTAGTETQRCGAGAKCETRAVPSGGETEKAFRAVCLESPLTPCDYDTSSVVRCVDKYTTSYCDTEVGFRVSVKCNDRVAGQGLRYLTGCALEADKGVCKGT